MNKILLGFGILIMIMSCSKKDTDVFPGTAKNQNMLKSTNILFIQCNPTEVICNLDDPNFIYVPPTPPAPSNFSATGYGNGMLKSTMSNDTFPIFTYILTGGFKYQISFTKCSATNGATCKLVSPDGKTITANTITSWTNPSGGSCSFKLMGCLNGAGNAKFEIDNLSFKVYSAVVSETTHGVNGTVYVGGNCSLSGHPYPMGSAAPSSIYETITANGLSYGDNIPLISVSYGALTEICANGALEKYTPWTAFYSDTISIK